MSLKPKDIRKMTSEERLQKLAELRRELMRLKMQARIGTIDNPGKIRAIKRTIARILTIENEERRTRRK